MNASQRREKIIGLLSESGQAVNASVLANLLTVSRQIIVGDVAILRASGEDILSTPRGYILNAESFANGFSFKVACMHGADMAEKEIHAIVDNGGKLVNVIIEHPIYGQLSGELNISSRYDIGIFLEKVKKEGVTLLSDLTEGIHLHTISCNDKSTADRIKAELQRLGVLLENS